MSFPGFKSEAWGTQPSNTRTATASTSAAGAVDVTAAVPWPSVVRDFKGLSANAIGRSPDEPDRA